MANLFIPAILALMPAHILSSPITPSRSLISGPHPVFQPDPAGRGTLSLIISCSSTFIVCIWTSVHADIPPLHASALVRFKYKAIWMVVCAIIPEGLIMCALGQWLEARRIREVWKEKFKNYDTERKEISMEEAFFVVMGGFTVCEISCIDEKDRTTPNYYTSTLTPDGFKSYIKSGQIGIDAFAERDISDKGKGNIITKAIACLQILWLVMQCVTRKISGLPLTLLELHVVIQVACTVVTYALWWFKPLDVQQPIRITILGDHFTYPPLLPSASSADSGSSERESLLRSPPVPLPPASPQEAEEDYSSCESHRFAPDKSSLNRPYYTRKGPPQSLPTIALAFHDIVLYLDGKLSMMLMESLLTIPIGGLHAIAWNVHFPTPLERLLWLISSIAMGSFPICIVFFAYWGAYHKLLVELTLEMSFVIPGRLKNLPWFLWKVATRVWAAGKKKGFKHLPMIALCLVLVAWYAAAVVYITVESYISVRSPPEGAFLTPKWSNFLPHL